MPPAAKLPLTFDVERLRADVAAASAPGWEKHFNPAHYRGEWSGVALRTNSTHMLKLYIDPRRADAFESTPELERCAYIPEVLAALPFDVRSVRLMKLGAGAVIQEHRDVDVTLAKGEARIHIPIVTNPGVSFVVGGEELALMPGECWYVDVDLPHRVENRGGTERIHLVMDAIANDWLRAAVAEEEKHRAAG